MTKLKRDARTWATRVMMGRARSWAVVEGSRHDTPFYESVARAVGVESVELIRAEDIEVDGSSGGGKNHALKIFATLEEIGKLSQRNNATEVDVVFFLDRDDDDYARTLVENNHVVYTRHADVEAEIVCNVDLARAVAVIYSLSSTQVDRVHLEDAAGRLAALWADWIAMRLASSDCGWSDTRFGQPSQINLPRYGEVDSACAERLCARADSASPEWSTAYEKAKNHVESRMRADDGAMLVKGKWLPQFIDWLVRQALARETQILKVDKQSLITACLMALDYQGDWMEHYAARLRPVLTT